ncbi:MAG TPA: malic enzyme-like NAD(P)-binding protein, partial [Nitrospira sp.]|nr:malic enzyme-like NAD(P)-binding protein [Nitrospira sp.]
FGGINLEDIAMPKCFRILAEARKVCRIPVWHDDQQGTATVLFAALTNALKVVGKSIGQIRIAMIGMGAANVPTYRFLKMGGADPASIVACDLGGILGTHRAEYRDSSEFVEQWQVCRETNGAGRRGGIAEALREADVCIAFSAGSIIKPQWVATMAKDAIIFACANPIPEIWPWEATEAGARIVATGRSDFPNQVNNSLVFPGIFRGALDVRARTISDEMAMAAAMELAACAEARGINDQNIICTMDEWEVVPRVAAATALKAQEQGLAQLSQTKPQLMTAATERITHVREAVRVLMKEGVIVSPPA